MGAGVPLHILRAAGLFFGVAVCLVLGGLVARSMVGDAGHPKWALQASLLPFALFGAIKEQSWVDYLFLAFWIGTVLSNVAGMVKPPDKPADK